MGSIICPSRPGGAPQGRPRARISRYPAPGPWLNTEKELNLWPGSLVTSRISLYGFREPIEMFYAHVPQCLTCGPGHRPHSG